MSAPRATTIVVPIYADWSSLKDCLESLAEHTDLGRNKVLLINDCGPEADRLEKYIKSFIRNRNGFEYHRNVRNLGFIKTCNKAVLELDKSGNNALLLNSDTKVTTGWLEEMTEVLYISPKHAVVSPRSNNATLTTIPLSAAVKKGIEPRASYAIFKKINPKLPRFYVAPVAHGFCMLIRRSVISKNGLFDTAFGKGYGEEVDFCMRIKAAGNLSIISNQSYVFHLEARSFTVPAKEKMLAENNQIIWQRYPKYRQLVRDYMERTVAAESVIEDTVGIKTSGNLKTLAKKIPVVYSLVRKTRRLWRGNS